MISDGTGVSLLTWQGGSGRYLVHRSEEPSFLGTTTTTLVPDGGAFFYLVATKP